MEEQYKLMVGQINGWRDFDVVENLLKSCIPLKKKNFKVLKKSNISNLN